ncbi:hypothetical protein [Legionella drancourtii]|uniref:Purine NTPase n=1 Tax=Legionella drancourtii LLAP12 TaxID=658187 RepID=G9EQ50_9GAMM|nr:hypothetical protein [Legionella drancourtii]EHL30625.1 hypothetical protein LDG_7396 [Legionella drancourtii LLAP12]
MLSKRERFQQWRGNTVNVEQKYINTASLISDYVDSVETLEEIRLAFSDVHPSKFKEFGMFNGRSLGAVVFFKLVVDEAREQFYAESGDTLLYQTLTDLNNMLISAYDRPKNLSGKEARDIFNAINTLLQIDDAFFANKKLSKNLFFSLYTLVHLVEPAFNSLGFIALGVVSTRIDIAETRVAARALLLRIAAKAQLLEPKEGIGLNILQQMHGYFNQRYLNIIKDEQPDETPKGASGILSDGVHPKTLAILQKLSLLEGEMQQISANITHFIALRTHKAELESKIQAIKALLDATTTNDHQVFERKYFLDLLATNLESYLVFRDSLCGEQKDLFLAKIARLAKAVEAQNLSIKINHGLSWITAPFSRIYRTAVPQLLQDMITACVPATLDSECKAMLKELAANCLVELTTELATQNQQLEHLSRQLFATEDKLKRSMFTEPLYTLTSLCQKTDAARHAVHAYQQLFFSIKENMDFLRKYQADAKTFGEFIRLNNNFWVKLSNFFAQFLSIFKTDTARTIDAARACQRNVAALAAKYQNAIRQEMQQIDDDPSLDETVKNQLKEHFSAEMNEIHVQQPNKALLRAREVRLLIISLSRLFATHPEPRVKKYTPEFATPTEDVSGLGTSPQPSL